MLIYIYILKYVYTPYWLFSISYLNPLGTMVKGAPAILRDCACSSIACFSASISDSARSFRDSKFSVRAVRAATRRLAMRTVQIHVHGPPSLPWESGPTPIFGDHPYQLPLRLGTLSLLSNRNLYPHKSPRTGPFPLPRLDKTHSTAIPNGVLGLRRELLSL